MIAGQKIAKREVIYSHTGWRKINGSWAFLHSGGAIGADGVHVELESNLANYAFSSGTVAKEAIAASLEFLRIAPERVTFPLISMCFLSPLNEFARQAGNEPAFILYLLGVTGALKSTLAALALCHFGEFTAKNLPGSFKDTANALEKRGFLLKDVLTVIDDYHPSGQKNEATRMERTAQEITRSYGDRTGRARLNSDTSLKDSYRPRGNVIITGEDLPNIAQSGLARHMVIELAHGDVDKERLSSLQENAGKLNVAMCGFIEWLIPQAADLPGRLNEYFIAYRNQAQSGGHARVPEAVAWLRIGFELFMIYAAGAGAVNKAEAQEYVNRAREVFERIAEEQGRRIENDKPSKKFVNTLRELLDTGACYVVDIGDMARVDNLKHEGFIGYYDSDYYYLYSEAVFKAVVQFTSQQGMNFPVSGQTLLKHLDYEGWIEVELNDSRANRLKVKRISGKPTRLIWLKKAALAVKGNEPVLTLCVDNGETINPFESA